MPEDLTKKDFPVPDTISKQNYSINNGSANLEINDPTRNANSECGSYDFEPLYEVKRPELNNF